MTAPTANVLAVRYAGNATRWKLQANDGVVNRYLSATERAAITAWQDDNWPWELEFHPGHTTGKPIYIRVAGNADAQNVPKMDTANLTASAFDTNLEALQNWEKLCGGTLKGKKVAALLNTGDQARLRVFLQTQFAVLKKIAKRYWDNEDPPADAVAAATRPCTATTGCLGQVPNEKGKRQCPACYLYS